jgi:hypothetical protein
MSLQRAIALPAVADGSCNHLEQACITCLQLHQSCVVSRLLATNHRMPVLPLPHLPACLRVWGVAEATAERWYASGARTLAQVAALPGLTAQQVTGLTYYEDFLVCIPREEVAECEALVWGAVVHAIKVGRPGRGWWGAGGVVGARGRAKGQSTACHVACQRAPISTATAAPPTARRFCRGATPTLLGWSQTAPAGHWPAPRLVGGWAGAKLPAPR